MAKRKNWAPSVKFEIALLALKGNLMLNDICKRYEVVPSQVNMWKKQLLDQGANLFIRGNNASDEAANKLERDQGKLYEKSVSSQFCEIFLKKCGTNSRGKSTTVS